MYTKLQAIVRLDDCTYGPNSEFELSLIHI